MSSTVGVLFVVFEGSSRRVCGPGPFRHPEVRNPLRFLGVVRLKYSPEVQGFLGLWRVVGVQCGGLAQVILVDLQGEKEDRFDCGFVSLQVCESTGL